MDYAPSKERQETAFVIRLVNYIKLFYRTVPQLFWIFSQVNIDLEGLGSAVASADGSADPWAPVKKWALQVSRSGQKDFDHVDGLEKHYDGGLLLGLEMGDGPDGLALDCLHHRLDHENGEKALDTAHGDPSLVETYKGSSATLAAHVRTSAHYHDR